MTTPLPIPPSSPATRVPALRAFGATHPGATRTRNEDSFFCDPGRGVFMVIDGVGGYAAGDVAAEIARDLISLRLRFRSGSAAERMYKAIATANGAIYHQSRTHPEQHGMACVLTAVLVEDGYVTVGHVGDTRLYLIHPGGITKVTHDHSVVGIREDRGELSEWEAMLHPRRNEILREVGAAHHRPGDEEFIDLYRFPFEPDTALLLCTDGLTDLVPSDVLLQTVLAHAGHPDRSVRALIDLANRAGGYDNVTVIVAEGPAFALAAVPPEHRSANSPGPLSPEDTSAPATTPTGATPPLWLAVGTALVLLLLWGLWMIWEAAPRGPTP